LIWKRPLDASISAGFEVGAAGAVKFWIGSRMADRVVGSGWAAHLVVPSDGARSVSLITDGSNGQMPQVANAFLWKKRRSIFACQARAQQSLRTRNKR
jgi:hypothetical protein